MPRRAPRSAPSPSTPTSIATPFVRQADLALRLPAPRGEVAAYLDHDLLMATARRAGADAIWPGWGFVAEDPVFADRVVAEGMRFLGPSGAAMRLLGDKIAAKRLAAELGVPISAWSGGVVADEADAARRAEEIGYPLVVKAAAGGGGRGIRVVAEAGGLADAFRAAGSEARAAFGDDRLFLERKVSGGRHVEVQIARDQHGHALAFGCRDCSVQRRHQKLIEEAPPPGLSARVLDRIVESSIRLADRVGYVGVGTVEFLVAGDDPSFLEVNPRLQVEHGVTEIVTGIDLVELQIRIARGESLSPFRRTVRGAAIEARVCAEDPAAGFLPTPGRVARFDPALGPRVRVDSGVVAGNVVPAAFDSLIAKVIASGETRDEARARLVAALTDFDLVLAGGATNKGYLIDLLESPELRAGGVDTGWLDRRHAGAGEPRPAYATAALVAAAILAYQRRRRDARVNFFAAADVAAVRAPRSVGQEIELSHGGVTDCLEVFALGSWRYRVRADGRTIHVTLREGDAHVALLGIGAETLRILHDATDSGVRIEIEGRAHRFGWQTAGEVRAATPAMVVVLHVRPGDSVVAGQSLGLLEAMKMEIAFCAPVAGVVSEVRVRAGQQVAAGDVLVSIDAAAEARESADARLALPAEVDPLDPLFAHGLAAGGAPDLAAAEACGAAVRRAALAALRDEVRAVLLGYDTDPERTERLIAVLRARLPRRLSPEFREELAEVRSEIVLFADLEQLFDRSPRRFDDADASRTAPSNHARLRMYVRRMRAGGAGVADELLGLLRTALDHYGIADLAHDDALERAVLRLFASRESGCAAHRARSARADRRPGALRRRLDRDAAPPGARRLVGSGRSSATCSRTPRSKRATSSSRSPRWRARSSARAPRLAPRSVTRRRTGRRSPARPCSTSPRRRGASSNALACFWRQATRAGERWRSRRVSIAPTLRGSSSTSASIRAVSRSRRPGSRTAAPSWGAPSRRGTRPRTLRPSFAPRPRG